MVTPAPPVQKLLVFKLLIVAAALSLIAAACSASSNDDEGGEEPAASPGAAGIQAATPTPGPTPTPLPDNAIIVGMVLAETNVMRDLDHQAGVAAEAAIQRINEAGGIDGRPVVVLRADTTSRISRADDLARRFLAQGASLLLVTCDEAYASPAVARAQAANVLTIAPCAAGSGWGQGTIGPLAFSMVTPARADGEAMAEVAFERGYRSAAVLVDDNDPDTLAQCGGFTDRFAELGGVGRVEPISLDRVASIPGDAELLEALQSDVVILCSFARLGLRMLNTIRDLEIATPILAGPTMDGGWRPPDVQAGLGDYSYVSYAAIEGDDPSDGVAGAIAAFQEVDGAPPSSGRFVVGADALDVFAAAVERTGSFDGAVLAAEIRSLSSISVSSGTLVFGGGQAPENRTMRVMRFDGSGFVFDMIWDS